MGEGGWKGAPPGGRAGFGEAREWARGEEKKSQTARRTTKKANSSPGHGEDRKGGRGTNSMKEKPSNVSSLGKIHSFPKPKRGKCNGETPSLGGDHHARSRETEIITSSPGTHPYK